MSFKVLAWALLIFSAPSLAVTMPDPNKTPGAVFPTVTSATTCVPGYTQTVRNVDHDTKVAVCRAYGITKGCPGPNYEIDHWVSLTLGGANDTKNLWPQPIKEAHAKDQIEYLLHLRVCHGDISLQQAQDQVKHWWLVPLESPKRRSK